MSDKIACFKAYDVRGKVPELNAGIAVVQAHFDDLPYETDRTDGLGMDFGPWRFNLRASNTEPLLRMNVESRADQA